MGKITSGDRRCKICGKLIQRNNAVGICSSGGTRKCMRAREALERRAKGMPEKKRNECDRPGCWRAKKRGGVCQMHWSRFERTGDYGPDEEIKIDLIKVRAGETYNSWTVLEDGEGVVNKVRCRCECGTGRLVTIAPLVSGVSKSCGTGCDARRAANPYLRVGDVYGRLTILEVALRSRDMVLCRCECGNEAKKNAGLVKNGHTASCGCRMGKFTHGLSRHPLYGTWDGMRDRCTNPRATGYDGYGACGVTVCEGWQGAPEGFLNFIADMGERPDGMTLDRIEVEGGYWCGRCAECVRLGRPANCRWATAQTQARNKRSVGKLAQQRNAALAEVERLNGLLAARNRKPPSIPAIQDALF